MLKYKIVHIFILIITLITMSGCTDEKTEKEKGIDKPANGQHRRGGDEKMKMRESLTN